MKRPRGVLSELASKLNPFNSVEDIRRLDQSENARRKNVAKAQQKKGKKK